MNTSRLIYFTLTIFLTIAFQSTPKAQVCSDYTQIISWTCTIGFTGTGGSWTKQQVCWPTYNFGGYPGCSMDEFLSGDHDAGDVDPRTEDPESDFAIQTPEMLCAVLWATQPEECEAGEYKDLSYNGCTGVPSNFHVASSHKVANITGACNAHDICYGSLGVPQATCDNDFLTDMLQTCVSTYGPPVNNVRDSYVINPRYQGCAQQASAYYVGVSVINGALALVDADFYNAAQNKAACNAWNDEYEEAGCEE